MTPCSVKALLMVHCLFVTRIVEEYLLTRSLNKHAVSTWIWICDACLQICKSVCQKKRRASDCNWWRQLVLIVWDWYSFDCWFLQIINYYFLYEFECKSQALVKHRLLVWVGAVHSHGRPGPAVRGQEEEQVGVARVSEQTVIVVMVPSVRRSVSRIVSCR